MQNLIKTASFHTISTKNLSIFIENQYYLDFILVFSFKFFNMTEQMTTHQSAVTAQVTDISFNVVKAQHEAQHSLLSIITI